MARRGVGRLLALALGAALAGTAGAQSLPGPPSAPSQPVPSAPTPGTAGANSSTPGAATLSSGAEAQAAANQQTAHEVGSLAAAKASLSGWKGLRVVKMEYEGVIFDPKDPLPKQVPQQEGDPLDPLKVESTIRQLFASGRYSDIRVEGQRAAGGVTLAFVGTQQLFVGRVTIAGVKDERLASLLEYATKLQPGADFTDASIPAATDGVRQSLATNGYFQPAVSAKPEVDAPNIQVNSTYTVQTGPQARVGQVTLEGKDPGFTVEEFRKRAKLKRGKVTRDTVSNALTRIRAQYQKRDHLEATATLVKQTYNAQRTQVDYDFNANQGPVVKVEVVGAKFSKGRLKLLLPIYEEGTIDNDLLNEGTFNMRDFLFQQGYFDATVTVKVQGEGTGSETVVFNIEKGVKHKVGSVTITGNRYFDADLLRERMQVQKADAYLRSGRYSPALMKSDVSAIQALYRANGFNQAAIAPTVKDVDTTASGKKLKVAELSVMVTVAEGQQQKFGPVVLAGVEQERVKDVKGLLNSQEGQPYSLITLSGDRDAILGYYLSHGFAQARVDVKQQPMADGARMNVTLDVSEGDQVFVDRVLLSGVEHTKPKVVEKRIRVHPGDPLDQAALLDTQRRMYDLGLFNEVNAAVQNPDGDDPSKNVLLQLTEAKRWDVTYGFGFEAETGTPQQGIINPASAILLGLSPSATYAQNGKTGVSPRVSLDVSRIDLRGTDESLTLHTTYGLLEEVATLTFQNPHFFGRQQLSTSVSGGYSNVQNISTFQASTLQGDYRVTQKVRKADTLIYNFEYRRVAVNPATLQVSANLIPQLSQPVRVGGPGLTWFHDKRDPGPLNATKGSYTSVDEFFSSSKFGSQTSFNRVDVSNSTYYAFGKRGYVLARNTRLGFENPFGPNPNVGSASCATNYVPPGGGPVQDLLATNPSCNAVPLPERLYAGGATSHRGFAINGAGPRDLQTGYPVGGNAVFINSTELRLPAPTLPYVGDSVSFVVFHDMGNVFTNISDMFPSVGHFRQPNQQTCANVSSAFGNCNFNYFSHAIGMGARYKTPVGPIRVDFSYNLNPPVYPVIYDFNGAAPYEGQAGHFNFFFSIGQAF
jgi:outer membrane protein insertion porin family